MKLAPDFTIKAYMAGLSFSDPEVLTRIETGLRKAGLPGVASVPESPL